MRWNIPAFIITLCLIAFFWVPLNNTIETLFVKPLFMNVKNHSGIVQFVLIVLLAAYYFMISKQMKRESWLSNRRILIIETIGVFMIFRFSGLYEFYGIGRGSPSYIDVVAILAVACELYVIVWNAVSNCNNTSTESEYTSFFIDQPTKKDELKRKFYAQVLVEKIVSTFSKKQFNDTEDHDKGSYTVLLSERYGQGKSSFFEQIKGVCSDKNIEVIVFKPWLSNDSGQMIFNFFNLLREKLGFHDKELRKLLQSYAIVASDNITGKAAKASLNLFDSISVETQHDRISRILKKERRLRVVLIDDVDRLQSDELLALIKLIRNTADFPYMAYIVAADKKAMCETLRTASIKDPDLYLKKFFNFELLFPADDGNVLEKLGNKIEEVLSSFDYSVDACSEIRNGIEKYSDYYTSVFSNLRDVYRFCNILSFELDVLRNAELNSEESINLLKDLYVSDFVKLQIIQYVSPGLYKLLRDYWFVLLKPINNGRFAIRDDYKPYVDNRESIRHFEEMISNINTNIVFEGANNTTDETKEEEILIDNLPSVIDKATPNEDELIKYLLDDLWQETNNYVDLRRICYRSQYFLYFSGRYRKDEISDKEAIQLFGLPKLEFQDEVKKMIVCKKDSIIHKLKRIVRDNKNIDKVALLQNVISLSYIDYQEYKQRKEFGLLGYYDFYKTQEYSSIIRSLYLKQQNEDCSQDHLFKVHAEFFKNTDQFAASALAITSMRPFDYIQQEEMSFVFTNEQVDEFSKNIIERFYKEVFREKPFGAASIEAIPCMRMANKKHWDNLFCNYIQSSNNPLEWLFRLFKLNDNNEGMCWDLSMVLAVLGETPMFDTFYERAEQLVGSELLQPFKEGMDYINPNNTDFSTAEKTNNKPFSKAAYEWLKTQKDT